MQPQKQKKMARADRVDGSIVLYRSAARSQFKAQKSLPRAEPWWDVVLGVPLFLRTLLRLVFVCLHRHQGPPVTLRESIPANLSGRQPVYGRGSYITCLDCGQNSLTTTRPGAWWISGASMMQKHWQELVEELLNSFRLSEVSLQRSAV